MRSFIAIDIEDSLKSKIQDIQNTIGTKYLKIKFVEPENLHFTPKFLGEIEENVLDNIYEILQKNLKNYKPFEINLKGLGAFPSFSYIRVLWIGIQDE
ncbi:MAG: RNA 2',3'-cyclic phosphodiesterase, partial [Methanomicrobia archaeon]|nr:RNA 2',3'-cyclic phosphodiesterase [Methanomicrobia archaeon]